MSNDEWSKKVIAALEAAPDEAFADRVVEALEGTAHDSAGERVLAVLEGKASPEDLDQWAAEYRLEEAKRELASRYAGMADPRSHERAEQFAEKAAEKIPAGDTLKRTVELTEAVRAESARIVQAWKGTKR